MLLARVVRYLCVGLATTLAGSLIGVAVLVGGAGAGTCDPEAARSPGHWELNNGHIIDMEIILTVCAQQHGGAWCPNCGDGRSMSVWTLPHVHMAANPEPNRVGFTFSGPPGILKWTFEGYNPDGTEYHLVGGTTVYAIVTFTGVGFDLTSDPRQGYMITLS